MLSTNSSDLDIVILYSDPLIKFSKDLSNMSNKVPVPAGEPVDYWGEINNLLKIFQDKSIKIMIKVASRKNLLDALFKKPKIIHIVCHGNVVN